MKYIFLIVLVAGVVWAQNRDVIIDEPNIALIRSTINYKFDGGCDLTTESINDAGIEHTTSTKPFNGARCGTARTAATKQANLDHGVGDGSQP